MKSTRKNYIEPARRIVLKIGTKVLLNHYRNDDKRFIHKFIDDIAAYKNEGYEFTIVTSGAVGFGMDLLNLDCRPTNLKKIQALASIGQSALMQYWRQLFEKAGLQVGQILLTYDIIENRQRYLHARDCLQAVQAYHSIPIVNENDSVAIDELKFGDNDTLSALTAILMDADMLILFSDIGGLYNDNPHINTEAKRINYIDKITDETFNLIKDRQNSLSIGGMYSKLMAAQRSTQMGTAVIITDGYQPDLDAILQSQNVGTFFKPMPKYAKKRKRWIFFNHKIKGKIFIDEGAETALIHHSKSLLPGGITHVQNEFIEGSIVGIYNSKNELIGKGISHYSSHEIEQIKGMRTEEIHKENSKRIFDEIIHRDNMIILQEEK